MSLTRERGGPPGPPRRDQHPTTSTGPRSLAKVARTVPPLVPLAVVRRITAEANRIEAELRDRECHCPGRAYVAHAWNLGSHTDGCRAGYAWLSVDDARVILQRLPRRERAAVILAIGGTS